MPSSRVPKTVTAPAEGWSKPAATFSRVVLPQPVGPTTETNSPSPTRSVVSRTAVYRSDESSRELNVHSMCSSARAGSMIRAVYRAGSTVFRIRPFHEFVRIGELEFDFACLHFGVEGRNDFERVFRARIRDDSVRRDGVGQRLDRVRVLSDEIDRRIETARGHRTAQGLLGSPQGAGVGDDLDVAVLLELGHHRIRVGNRVDLAALQRRDGRSPEADPYDGDIGRLEAAGGNKVIEDHVRARARG